MTCRQLVAASVATVALSSLLAGRPAAAGEKMANPDFTRGEKIPKGADHDWTLGATGARGWMYSDGLETSVARQIAITKVEKGSPADGILAVGDAILGVGDKQFPSDPRSALGKALTVAESEAGGGTLALIRWRAGKTEDVVVKLPVLGTYSPTAPYDCPKSKRILTQGCETLAKRVADQAYAERTDAIPRCLNALALLASGKPEYLPLLRKEAQWASGFSVESMATWYYGYVSMFLAEYKMATGDDSVMPGLRRLALEAANGQSAVGSWGHRFANPEGRLYGYGMMNAPGLPLTISLILAREAGIKDPKVDEAIKKSATLIRFYVGKGCVPYGDHAPWTETHEDNGKCGMAAVMFDLLGEVKAANFFSRMSVASHGPERDCGHTGNFCNVLWSVPGVAQSGPNATGAWFKEFGAWYFDLARRWDGTFIHQGPPEMHNDSYGGWDCTGGYLLAYAMPLRKIRLTGKKPSVVPPIDPSTAEALILDGRGWSNNDRNSFYDKLASDEIMRRLGSWSPIVRERAAMALGRRKEAPVSVLTEMLASPSLETRYGACLALANLKGAAAPAIPALKNTLQHEDLWLRLEAARTLASIGKPAMSAVPELLTMLARAPSKDDPRGMEQRYLCFALFDRGGMLGRSLEGVDREALYAAVRAGLRNEDGRARGSICSVYRNLSSQEIKPLLPAIYRAAVEYAASGEMFADAIRVEGLKLLAKNRVEEGIDACVKYVRTQNPWDSQERTPELMKILLNYGAQAKSAIPELKRIADAFEQGEKDFPKQLSLQKAKCVRETIRAIEASNEQPALISLEQKGEAKL